MADTQNLTVTTTWAQLPSATNFVLQNTAPRRVLRVIIAATTPAATLQGHSMEYGQSTGRLGPGIHWVRVRSAEPIIIPFTITEV